MAESASEVQPDPQSDPARRLGRRYCFADPDMDLFFVAALGWGPSGGLDVGQAFYVANRILDGDPDSWVSAFAAYGDFMTAEADAWLDGGHRRNAGESRLKAFASYRSAWQFAAPGPRFAALVAQHRRSFSAAMDELALPATFFGARYGDGELPGVLLRRPEHEAAPVALIIGGADTCFEDLFLTLGRALFERGYAVAMADLPGQGITQATGLFWEAEAERPIGAVIDLLAARFGVVPHRTALIGLSLGGYFVARAAGHERRLATVIASTPFPSPADLFQLTVGAARQAGPGAASDAARRSRAVSLWKAGARTPEEFISRTRAMRADPALVTVPFLSILGAGDSPVFAAQAEAWDRDIRSERKRFVRLDAETGADGHVQVNNRRRLAQECVAWMDEVFGRSDTTSSG